MMVEFWLLVAYIAGSLATYFLMHNQIVLKVTDNMIDKLITEGYLRSKRDENGETEIVKWHEPIEERNGK